MCVICGNFKEFVSVEDLEKTFKKMKQEEKLEKALEIKNYLKTTNAEVPEKYLKHLKELQYYLNRYL